MSLYCLSSNNSENINHRHLPLTGTDHCNSRFLKMFNFRETITHFRTIIFSQSLRFQFSSPTLDVLCVSFNVHHFFMQKQFICVDCYKAGWLSPILCYTRKHQMNIGCKSSWNEEGQMCARICSIWMEFNCCELLNRNILIHPRVWSHPWTPLRRFRVIGWLVRWIHVSPAFDF